jgi:hypothetical protein
VPLPGAPVFPVVYVTEAAGISLVAALEEQEQGELQQQHRDAFRQGARVLTVGARLELVNECASALLVEPFPGLATMLESGQTCALGETFRLALLQDSPWSCRVRVPQGLLDDGHFLVGRPPPRPAA